MSDYPCPACGFLSFGEPPGSYDICSVCGWEDDHVQLEHPTMGGGANAESLLEAQRRALGLLPLEVRSYGDLLRAPLWRPLQSGDPGLDERSKLPRNSIEYFNSASSDVSPYYWELCGPRAVESILAEVDARASGKTDFCLWVPEHLAFQGQDVELGIAMTVVLRSPTRARTFSGRF